MESSLVKLNIEDLLNCINGKDSEGNDLKVKIPPHKKVKDEFNKFINHEISQRRKKSSISSMRSFHNFIKKHLLYVIVQLIHSKQINLLDIAVGRGGDLAKWNKNNIKYVFGFDKSEKSITNTDPEDQGAFEMATKGLDKNLIEKVLKLIDQAEYKRRQYPPGTKISTKAFGRDRRQPITNSWRESL